MWMLEVDMTHLLNMLTCWWNRHWLETADTGPKFTLFYLGVLKHFVKDQYVHDMVMPFFFICGCKGVTSHLILTYFDELESQYLV